VAHKITQSRIAGGAASGSTPNSSISAYDRTDNARQMSTGLPISEIVHPHLGTIAPMTDSDDKVTSDVLLLSGDLDVESSGPYGDRARALIAQDGLTRLTVDLEHVAFIDSSGIGLLVKIRTECVNRGVDLVLMNVPRRTTAMLNLTGLSSAFEIVD
jgi:anti-anti-sigma factor